MLILFFFFFQTNRKTDRRGKKYLPLIYQYESIKRYQWLVPMWPIDILEMLKFLQNINDDEQRWPVLLTLKLEIQTDGLFQWYFPLNAFLQKKKEDGRMKWADRRIDKELDRLNSLADNKILALSKLNVTQNFKLVSWKVENNVGKEENAGYQYFLLFQQCFQKVSFSGSLRVRIFWKG